MFGYPKGLLCPPAADGTRSVWLGGRDAPGEPATEICEAIALPSSHSQQLNHGTSIAIERCVNLGEQIKIASIVITVGRHERRVVTRDFDAGFVRFRIVQQWLVRRAEPVLVFGENLFPPRDLLLPGDRPAIECRQPLVEIRDERIDYLEIGYASIYCGGFR